MGEDLSTGYGLRFSTEIYGRKRFSNEDIQETCFVLTEISGNLREFTGECNLGIMYSSSLLFSFLGCSSPTVMDWLWEFSGTLSALALSKNNKTQSQVDEAMTKHIYSEPPKQVVSGWVVS